MAELQKMDYTALEEKKQEIIARCVEAAPGIVEALIEKAAGGNVKAAQLVLQVAGVLAQRGQSQVAIANQIIITPEEQEQLMKAYLEAVGYDPITIGAYPEKELD